MFVGAAGAAKFAACSELAWQCKLVSRIQSLTLLVQQVCNAMKGFRPALALDALIGAHLRNHVCQRLLGVVGQAHSRLRLRTRCALTRHAP